MTLPGAVRDPRVSWGPGSAASTAPGRATDRRDHSSTRPRWPVDGRTPPDQHIRHPVHNPQLLLPLPREFSTTMYSRPCPGSTSRKDGAP